MLTCLRRCSARRGACEKAHRAIGDASTWIRWSERRWTGPRAMAYARRLIRATVATGLDDGAPDSARSKQAETLEVPAAAAPSELEATVRSPSGTPPQPTLPASSHGESDIWCCQCAMLCSTLASLTLYHFHLLLATVASQPQHATASHRVTLDSSALHCPSLLCLPRAPHHVRVATRNHRTIVPMRGRYLPSCAQRLDHGHAVGGKKPRRCSQSRRRRCCSTVHGEMIRQCAAAHCVQ